MLGRDELPKPIRGLYQGPGLNRQCRMRYGISYDVGEDRRRQQVVKRLKRSSVRLQYSVFEGELTEAAAERLWKELLKLIQPEEDGLLMVRVCGGCMGVRREAGTTRAVGVEDEVI